MKQNKINSMDKETVEITVQVIDTALSKTLMLKVGNGCKLVDEKWVKEARDKLAKQFSVAKEKIQIGWFFTPKTSKDLTLSDWAKSGKQYLFATKIEGIVELQQKVMKLKKAELQKETNDLKSCKLDYLL